MNFKAVMLDFDGTVTDKGSYNPGPETISVLAELSKKMPIGFCTGRDLPSFIRRAFSSIVEELDEKDRIHFLENLFLFAENGAFGFEFNVEKGRFEEIYRTDWPEDFISKLELKKSLAPLISEYGEFCENAHEIVLVIRTLLTDIDIEDRNIDDVYALSGKIYDACIDFLCKFDSNFEEYVHVGNSGIGVVMGPADGDKDSAILKFADVLNGRRGISFDSKASEILVLGDSPLPSGNDHYFLRGEYGTPFTVGPEVPGKEFPIPVKDDTGKRLYHEKGTVHLLKSLFL